MVSFVNFYSSSIISFDMTELTCHLLPPPSYMNHKLQAAPSGGFNLKPIKISWANDHINGEFCDFFILSTILLGRTNPDLLSSAIALLDELNARPALPCLQSKAWKRRRAIDYTQC
jgi:hypothetical protein